jgi:hypothetical protein
VIMYVRTFKTYIIVGIQGSLIGWAVIMYVHTLLQLILSDFLWYYQ